MLRSYMYKIWMRIQTTKFLFYMNFVINAHPKHCAILQMEHRFTQYGAVYNQRTISFFNLCGIQGWNDLDLSLLANSAPQTVFDESLFINPSITHLKVACFFVKPTTISWKNLKSLCLSIVDLNDDVIKNPVG